MFRRSLTCNISKHRCFLICTFLQILTPFCQGKSCNTYLWIFFGDAQVGQSGSGSSRNIRGFSTRGGWITRGIRIIRESGIRGLNGFLTIVVARFLRWIVIVFIKNGRAFHGLATGGIHGVKFLIGEGHRVGIDCRLGELRIECHLASPAKKSQNSIKISNRLNQGRIILGSFIQNSYPNLSLLKEANRIKKSNRMVTF